MSAPQRVADLARPLAHTTGSRVARFVLIDTLGRGAQATVWRAHDERLDREVALKLLLPGAEAISVNQWLHEARAVSRLSYPNIVPVFEADDNDGQPYLVFELVRGRTLAEALRAGGAMTPRAAVTLLRGVLEALRAAHAQGIVHRDLTVEHLARPRRPCAGDGLRYRGARVRWRRPHLPHARLHVARGRAGTAARAGDGQSMYRALGFRCVVFALKDPKSGVITGRFGLGDGAPALVPQFNVSLQGGRGKAQDLLAAVCQKGVDTLIADATAANVASRLPAWLRRQPHVQTFLLLPMAMKGATFALIYADHAQAGSIGAGEKELSLLRTLRNQAVLVFRQAG